MKRIKFIMAVAAMLIACLSVNAQSAWGNGGPTKGYKGFADISYGFGSGDFSIGDHLSASTTHGYQINSYIFVGGGLAIDYLLDAEDVTIPIYAAARITLPMRITPYLETRMGYAANAVDGFYLAETIGVRVPITDRFAFNGGLSIDNYRLDLGHDHKFSTAIALKVGIEF